MPPTALNRAQTRLAIVGTGRLGSAFARRLAASNAIALVGPLGREAFHAAAAHAAATCDAVLLCVPDAQIAGAAAAIPPGPLVGHCSGATGLQPLAPHDAFSLHPLMTVTAAGADFGGVTAAIDGSTERATRFARRLAAELGLQPIRVAPADRAAYHAAASLASNFLVTLEAAAERLGATAGLERQALVPLVRATVENWATLGAEGALTGPVARGDEATVARQREAVAQRTPELLPLFDSLTEATRALATAAPSPTPTRELEHA
ncbi:MAG: DUF2520 domain-containing protein [Conexibacteraceae bacterium]|nr:DUF2520 domain-containing protein [Conexibacteraceae bacterium]